MRSGIPETVRHNTKWQQSLEMIDELAAWGHKPPMVVADAGYGDTTAFRLGFTSRGINYVVAVTFTTTAHLATATPEPRERTSTKGRPPLPQYPGKALSLKALALAAGRKALHEATWSHGTKKRPEKHHCRHEIPVPGHPHPTRQPRHPPERRQDPSRGLDAGRMARP